MRARAVLLAVALTFVVAPTPAEAQAEAQARTSTSTYQVTLITGDVVVLHEAGDGKRAAWVERTAGKKPQRPARIYQDGEGVHVIPDEAASYVASGMLDDKLFNVSLLVAQGYHDAASRELPLLVQGSAAGLARSAKPLRAIGAQSVAVDKGQLSALWSTLKTTRRTAATKVWLNAKVRARLDQSVPQVGAPTAWRKGYDGRGIRVAVLDTGYDPAHPDLVGRVKGAANFTDTADATDRHGHGTHVAATASGRKGVAPRADLLIGKVLDDFGEGTTDQIIAGMEWAVAQGARVVNMSVGTPWQSDGTDPMSQAVDRLTSSTGALFVVAAGNSGPEEQTVGAPGAATEALTVGAVTKSDEPAWFSSRGPRFGDLAIKPEIVAPGAGIVAARAAGTTLGSVLDARYTALNGTSMATPHVAGAAAILAQQNPGWKADRLKARLVSSSRWLTGEPVTFQGAGRLDVARAVGNSENVDTPVLSLGRLDHAGPVVRRTLTYTNPTNRLVILRVEPEIEGTGSYPYRPSVTLSRSLLIIPAHGRRSVEVTVTPQWTRAGAYAGRIVARSGTQRLTTVTTFTVGAPPRTVTVRGIDRNGQPAQGPVDLWSHDTGESVRVFLRDGVASAEVPEGRYTLVATLETWSGPEWPPLSETVAGDPELTVRGDLTISYDARLATAAKIRTDRTTEPGTYDVMWHRAVGRRSFVSQAAQGLAGQELFLMPSRTARQGVFEFVTQWQLPQPLLQASVNGRELNGLFASPPLPYVGSGPLKAAYAGRGTAEDFAAIDVRGKMAVVSRSGEFGELTEQARRAKDAGAVLVLAHNDRPGPWVEGVFDAVLPAYTIDEAAGATLRQALENNPGATIDVTGRRDSQYIYELSYTDKQRIPAGRTKEPGRLATVESDYRENSARQQRREWWIPYSGTASFGNGMSFGRNGPVKRTEYVSTEDVMWQRFGQPHEFLNLYWTSSSPERLRAGARYRQTWWGPLVHPAVPPITGAEELGSPVARFRDAIRVLMPHYSYGGTLRGTIFEQMGDQSELSLRRNGQLVGTADWPEAQFTVPPDAANYELRFEVTNGAGNWSDTSVHTESTWRFRSARPAKASEVLPLVQLGYELATGERNEVPSGTSYELTVKPGYQPGFSGRGRFIVAVEVSYDDGATWRRTTTNGNRFTVPAASGPGFASIRATAKDAQGNSLSQRIDRAWRIS